MRKGKCSNHNQQTINECDICCPQKELGQTS